MSHKGTYSRCFIRFYCNTKESFSKDLTIKAVARNLLKFYKVRQWPIQLKFMKVVASVIRRTIGGVYLVLSERKSG